MKLINRLRRRWTIAIVGRESGHKTSLESLYRFRSQQEALARAAELNRQASNDLTEFQVIERDLHSDRSGGNSP